MTEPLDLAFVLDALVAELAPDVQHVIAAAADGLVVAKDSRLPRDRADQLAAFTSALTGLVNGIAQCLEAGPVKIGRAHV